MATFPETVPNHSSRVAVVTGGSRGIGRDTVIRLAERGVRSIFTYKARAEQAETVVSDAARAGAETLALQLDVSKAGTFERFAAAVRDTLTKFGVDRFDYLANIAGTSSSANLEIIDEAEIDSLFAVHVKGPLFLTQKLLPLMKDGGRIVNISSGLARVATPNRIGYAPVKAAVEALSRNMALELGPRRISVNVVAPGAIATDFSGGIVRDDPKVNRTIADNTALGRVGQADDVGPVIAALLSDQFGWVNAQRIEVAGGFHI